MSEELLTLLTSSLEAYDAIIIAEDKNTYIHGVIDAVQKVNEKYLLPIYIAKTTSQLARLKQKLDATALRTFYILDNKYTIEENEPKGQELIEQWQLENDCVMITSSYFAMREQKPPYPVFDKLMPEFDLC
ncbi:MULTISPECIES: hypothetical protein [Cysteiniphilum]|uniref:Uncharacterized protein n=2 Tax=Cysteiniphilum litorale TaxID=2056700 RepID=A0A8J2Z6H8_9GAMM|nr:MULTISPECIES: hypothetical protein [Cysteiniphilum]GGG06281.1 hypothetical protein GCM10010995_24750 [Cysteiniphilum litorale]